MQIVEVKNNLVKASYDTASENLILSGFVVIKDATQSFIGQIIHLEANFKGNFAIIKLLFTFDANGVISNYNGSIPDINSTMEIVQSQELLELLPAQNPVVIGNLAQQNTILRLDRSLLEEKLLVCSEKEDDNDILIENMATQLAFGEKKVLIVDLNGNIGDNLGSENKIVAGQDFKLPLNYETINFIYEKGLEGAKAETKAFIQEIFLEVQDYVKTLAEKFIPFETFMNVVDTQYDETGYVELVLLKNKLLKYYESGIFAQDKNEFNRLKYSLKNKDITILDLSQMDGDIQREMISYTYTLINELNNAADKETYVFLSLNNSNSDKKLLKQIYTMKQAYSVPICPYSYKYLKELKQLSKNLILFAPIQQQEDFASYNIFLNKLNAHEFVIYGHSTHHLPLIILLEKLNLSAPEIAQVEEELPTETPEEALLNEQIKKDVDKLFTVPSSDRREQEDAEEEQEEEFDEEYHVPEHHALEHHAMDHHELTEEDLDLIDDLNIVDNEGPIKDFENNISDDELADEIEDDNVIDVESEEGVNEAEIEELTEEEEAEEDYGGGAQIINMPVQNPPVEPPPVDILPANMASTPIVPVYSADIQPQVESDELVQGDTVMHAKYGKGTVEKLINYGSKTLCSIHFDNVGRRLLDPTLAEIKKIEE